MGTAGRGLTRKGLLSGVAALGAGVVLAIAPGFLGPAAVGAMSNLREVHHHIQLGSNAVAGPFKLRSVDLVSPTVGYGFFRRTPFGDKRSTFAVASTTDGGRSFGRLVPIGSTSVLYMNKRGEGFADGTTLEVTRNGGRSWQRDTEWYTPSSHSWRSWQAWHHMHPQRTGQVAAVASFAMAGTSAWMTESRCSDTRSSNPTAPPEISRCHLTLLTSPSADGSWTPARAQPFPGAVKTSAGQLAAGGPHALYVVGTVRELGRRHGALSLRYSSNGGRTWSSEHIPCGLRGGSGVFDAALSASSDGTVFAVCDFGTRGQGGNQVKTVLFSADHGKSWSTRDSCDPSATRCLSGSTLDEGSLVGVDAISKSSALMVSAPYLLRTDDAGTSWTRVDGPVATLTGGVWTVSFSNTVDGVAVYANKLWRTVDGGAKWRYVTPSLGPAPAPSETSDCLYRGVCR